MKGTEGKGEGTEGRLRGLGRRGMGEKGRQPIPE